uniref:FXNA-like protease n=1 Tax=Glossina palpalis gambiensis TaxID=67801 RepID=A0A1B0BKI4_9MUSC
MIAVMLETLRVITKRETNLKHSIVFLFNGAEENPLQGSHAFITQHEWAANVKAVINLDSAGSGGREILFQSGPGHPWLMKYYGAHIVHPYASTIAEELFQNGFVPSETDYRIFRDFGHIPGLDMAHSFNGFVYHTKYDRFTTIPRRTYQRTGDNVLALTKAIANAVELEDPSVNLLSLVRKSKTILSCFGIIWIIFMGIAASPMGFPYVEKEAPQRFYAVHSTRTFHDDSPAMLVKYEDFGFYVVPVDRRPQSIDFMFQETNFTKSDANFCETEIMCGFPIYSSRWLEWRNQSFWVEASQPTKIGWATLKIISKEQTSSKTILFTLEVAGPHHISIFIQPMHGVKLMDWSFTKIPLEQNFTAPYYLYFSYALDPTPLRFHLEFKWETEDWSGSTFAIALIGHKVDDINTTDDFREFLTSFPAWAHVSAWTSSYESWKL